MRLMESLFPQVYVDLDDVLGETIRAFIGVLAQSFNKIVEFDDVYSFDLGKSFGLESKELADFMVLAHKPSILMSVQPMDGAAQVLEGWRSSGIYINVITGRPISALEVTRKWLVENKIPHDSLSVIDKYGHSKGNATHKVLGIRTITRSDFCIAIEDSSRMARFIASNVGVPIALFDRPWNQKIARLSEGSQALVVRCRNWNEIDKTFTSMDIPKLGRA